GDRARKRGCCSENQDQKRLVKLVLGEGQETHQGVDQRIGLRLRLADLGFRGLRARLAAHGLGVPADRLCHQAPPWPVEISSLPKCASASAIVISTSSAYSIPQWRACSGTRLSGVMPGWVLVSSRNRPSSPSRSSQRKSDRLVPRQPSKVCALSA